VANIRGEYTPRWETLAEKKLGVRHFSRFEAVKKTRIKILTKSATKSFAV
jgi:hypothetical protein